MESGAVTSKLPTYNDVVEASHRLKGKAVRTPLLESPVLNRKIKGRLLLKPEVLQRVGAFKFRGAYNFISLLSEEERKNGVVAFSSGNHAQGVACAAELFGIPAWIVMPSDAPKAKLEGTLSYGAEVVPYNRETESREEIAAQISKEKGIPLIPSYDHPWIIAGQGTTGLEIVEQCEEKGIVLDSLVIPCCGGGLTAGCALAVSELSPKTQLCIAEPEGFDDTIRSINTGKRVQNELGHQTLCDALIMPTPGEITFEVNRHRIQEGYTVTDNEVLDAMALAFQHLKIVIEPGGAAALAAVLAEKGDFREKTVCVIASGGNVEPALFQKALERVVY